MKKDNKNNNDFLKRSAIFCLSFLFWSFLLSNKTVAQGADEGASLGVKIGLNTTSYDVVDATLKKEPGFNLGIFSNAHLSKCFALQPELNLNVLNSTISVNNELTNTDFKVMLSYLEFALLGRAHFGKLYVLAGPYISYLANASISDESAANGTVDRNSFHDVDYGFAFSAGMQLKRWDLGLRYNHGVYKIGKPFVSDNDMNIFRNAKTSSLQLYAGYYF